MNIVIRCFIAAAVALLALAGFGIAQQYGGSGGSLDDLAVVYTAAGRALCPSTVHSTARLTTVSNESSSNGNASAGACTSVT